MPGWVGSNRRDRLPADWPRIRGRVLRRDGYQCTWIRSDGDGTERCPEPATEVDHIRRGDDHDETNLRGLCSYHHGIKSAAEGGRARAFKRQRIDQKFLRTDEHPGLL